MLQLIANMQEQVANTQQQLANLQKQMQADIAALRLEVRPGNHASTRLTNCNLPDSMLLRPYNNQGQLPDHPTITRETLLDEQRVNTQQLVELL